MLLKFISQPSKKRKAPLAFKGSHLKLTKDVNGECFPREKEKDKKKVRFSDSLDIKEFEVDRGYEGEKDPDYESKKEVPTLKRSDRSFSNSLCNLTG